MFSNTATGKELNLGSLVHVFGEKDMFLDLLVWVTCHCFCVTTPNLDSTLISTLLSNTK